MQNKTYILNSIPIPRTICPNCHNNLQDQENTHYDYFKLEITCRKCGLLLYAPPCPGVILPEWIKIY